MIFGKTKLEMKVGIFVFIGLVILVVFILSIGGVKTWSSGYKVDFIFNFVNGVKRGAPVRFAGVDVGEVKAIKFYYDSEKVKTKVRLTCWVSKRVGIPLDSKIWVNTLGLLGEKYVEIIPGQDYGQIMAAGQEIDGEDPLPMNEIMKDAKNIADNVNIGIEKILHKEGTVGKLLYDDKIYNELDALVTDIKKHPWKLFFKTKEKK
ncbi:MAG: MlaD family protein [Candidatus Omnitrophica bacterium]|nr:MlaD family protein [Candidatus Omnitrophota bacterium]MDD5662199.1 MlaD family protein [Candidatus Omnitrophota bacterium]